MAVLRRRERRTDSVYLAAALDVSSSILAEPDFQTDPFLEVLAQWHSDRLWVVET